MTALRVLIAGIVIGLLAAVIIALIAPSLPDHTAAPSTPSTAPPPTTAATACGARGALPDPVCTPGASDPRVTQANIAATICVSGYTATVRPPSTYTNALKIDQMRAYGLTGTPADYEEDHLIALELGGDPRDPHNLWPEPRRSIGGRAEDKDTVENALHADVCAGRISLAEAQRRIATDWTTAR